MAVAKKVKATMVVHRAKILVEKQVLNLLSTAQAIPIAAL
jgi:hypothetical protein